MAQAPIILAVYVTRKSNEAKLLMWHMARIPMILDVSMAILPRPLLAYTAIMLKCLIANVETNHVILAVYAEVILVILPAYVEFWRQSKLLVAEQQHSSILGSICSALNDNKTISKR